MLQMPSKQRYVATFCPLVEILGLVAEFFSSEILVLERTFPATFLVLSRRCGWRTGWGGATCASAWVYVFVCGVCSCEGPKFAALRINLEGHSDKMIGLLFSEAEIINAGIWQKGSEERGPNSLYFYLDEEATLDRTDRWWDSQTIYTSSIVTSSECTQCYSKVAALFHIPSQWTKRPQYYAHIVT